MRKSILFLAGGMLSMTGALLVLPAAAQHGDTQAAIVRINAKSALYDKNTVLNLFQNQDFDEAIDYLSPALAADSANLTLLGYTGYAYYMKDNVREAQGCYERILRIDSNNVTALHYLVLLQSGQDPDQALDYAGRLLRLQPERAAWWRVMGELSVLKHRPDTALTFFNQAYMLSPGDVKTIAGLSDILIEKKNFGRVDSILDLALARDSINATLLRLRVRAAYFNKDYAAALVPGERLVQMADQGVQALNWLALSYYNLKDYPACVRVCEHMLDMGFELEQVYYYEARALTQLKQFQRSDSLLRICLKKAVSPTAEWYYNDLAGNHEELKEYKAAVAHYDTAFYLFKEPLMLYNCGRICETGLHNMARARQYYQRYLALARPETPEEKKAYRFVKARWGKK